MIDEEIEWELALRASNGAEFMDAIDPEWFWLVNSETLNMAGLLISSCGCVLQQHAHDDDYTPSEYGLSTWEEAQDLGFLIMGFRFFLDWDYLTECWREEIECWREEIDDRRAAALGATA